jgi:hypothetical protein
MIAERPLTDGTIALLTPNDVQGIPSATSADLNGFAAGC